MMRQEPDKPAPGPSYAAFDLDTRPAVRCASRARLGYRTEHRRPRLCCGGPQPRLGCGHLIRLDAGGMAPSGGAHRPLFRHVVGRVVGDRPHRDLAQALSCGVHMKGPFVIRNGAANIVLRSAGRDRSAQPAFRRGGVEIRVNQSLKTRRMDSAAGWQSAAYAEKQKVRILVGGCQSAFG